jgi:RNA polymerase sigma-70 factor (ECF subfamily)
MTTEDDTKDSENHAAAGAGASFTPERAAELVAAARAGDRAAFQALFEHYYRLIAVMTYQAIGHAPDVDDLTQETFLRAWRGLPRLRRSTRFLPWLLTIARRLATDWQRAAARRPVVDAYPLDTLAHPGDPLGELAAAEDRRALLAALGQLPDRYRLVLVLRFQEGLSPGDIARRLGEPSGTVRNRIFRGLEKLSAVLDARGRGGTST